jgi:hypothetical protein
MFKGGVIRQSDVLRVGDVALCCPACAGARQYRLHAVSVSLVIYSSNVNLNTTTAFFKFLLRLTGMLRQHN